MTLGRPSARAAAAGVAALGLVSAAAPRRVAVAAAGRGGAAPDPRIVRVLGLRQLGQGAVLIARPQDELLAAAAAVDGLHALSLVPLIVASRRYRRPAAISALLAVASAVAQWPRARR